MERCQIDGSEYEDVEVGKKALNEVFRARICMKRSGSGLKQFRRDLSNGRNSRVRQHPQDVSEAHRQIECFNPIFSIRKKPDGGAGGNGGREVNGDQHLWDGGKIFPSFKCKRHKPEHMGAKRCTFTTKVDGLPVNTHQAIDKKFEDLKEAKKRASANPTTTGTQFSVIWMVYQTSKM